MASPKESSRGLTQPTSTPSTPSSPAFSAAETAADSLEQSLSTSSCPLCHTSTDPAKDLTVLKKDLERPCHGWPELVQVMVKYPGFESFQAFRDLNIKSLLYYQAELVKIRQDLHALEWNDHIKGGFDESATLCSRVDTLLQCEDDKNGRAKRQIKLVKKMREVLKDYNDALLQYSQINELPEAESFNVNNLHEWLQRPGMGNLHIAGPGQDSWGKLEQIDRGSKSLWSQFKTLVRSIFWEKESDKIHLDLVVPHKGKPVDSLTRWVASQVVPFRHNLRITSKETKENAKNEGIAPFRYILRNSFRRSENRAKKDDDEVKELPSHHKITRERSSNASTITFRMWNTLRQRRSAERIAEKNSEDALEDKPTLITYRMSRMIRFTSIVTTIVACLLPIVAIAVLAKMHSQSEVLGFIALFTAIFAIGLMCLTNSDTSRTEIFTATAAFAAVLVVFVQNQNGGSNGT